MLQIDVDAAAGSTPPSRKRRRQEVSTKHDDSENTKHSPPAKTHSTPQHVYDVLRANPLFGDLREPELETIISLLMVVQCEAEQVVIQEGDLGHNLYIVDSGEFGLYTKSRGETPMRIYKTGDSFGEVALVHNVRCRLCPPARPPTRWGPLIRSLRDLAGAPHGNDQVHRQRWSAHSNSSRLLRG